MLLEIVLKLDCDNFPIRYAVNGDQLTQVLFLWALAEICREHGETHFNNNPVIIDGRTLTYFWFGKEHVLNDRFIAYDAIEIKEKGDRIVLIRQKDDGTEIIMIYANNEAFLIMIELTYADFYRLN